MLCPLYAAARFPLSLNSLYKNPTEQVSIAVTLRLVINSSFGYRKLRRIAQKARAIVYNYFGSDVVKFHATIREGLKISAT
jgi:hypothetical protein